MLRYGRQRPLWVPLSGVWRSVVGALESRAGCQDIILLAQWSLGMPEWVMECVMLIKGACAKVFRTSGWSARAWGHFLISQTHPRSLFSFVVFPCPCCLSCLPKHFSVLDYLICRREGKRKTPSRLVLEVLVGWTLGLGEEGELSLSFALLCQTSTGEHLQERSR